MSHTDKTRPEWVQCNDHRRDVVATHGYLCRRSDGTDCDLPAWPVDKQHNETWCCYRPTENLSRHIFGDNFVKPRSRRPYRRAWLDSERTVQQAIRRSLTRDAMYGADVNEDIIDNRKTHHHAEYGGGWWD